jgi:arylsulfatase A
MTHALILALATLTLAVEPPVAKPNVVVVLADDLGYGDLSCLNPRGKIATPNFDRVAVSGMTFTDAHSASAVCSPTRYALLTGRYAWRTRLDQGVLLGYSPPLIAPGRLTVASLLKANGYATACVGKWHLGLDWPLTAGGTARNDADGWKVDYARPFGRGPTTLGFDEYFGISASLDMPPYVILENDRARSVPTVEKTWIRKGPAAADFEAIDVLPALVERATTIIEHRAADAKAGKPFFLYLPLTAPHTPIEPTKPWQGKSGLSAFGDFVLQVDAALGRIVETLERNGVAENTLLIVTSDNGCAPMADMVGMRKLGHDSSAGFRGAKADVYEGGHRIPLFVRWPGRIKAGSKCMETVGLVDLTATCAELVGATLPPDAGEDSVSLLPTLVSRASGPIHEAVVHHSANGSFAIRQRRWKLAFCPDSGGWSTPKPGSKEAKGLPPVQLFDMAADPSETRNVAAENPEVVANLTKLMARFVAEGRSTPGPKQANDRAVKFTREEG